MVKIALCIVLAVCWSSQGQYYNCLTAMEMLITTQNRLIQHIQKYQSYITDRKKALIVQKFLSRCRREHERSELNPERYLSNPINTFALITRLSRDLHYIESILNQTTTGVMKYTPINLLEYPTEVDVSGITVGIVRLQLLYDLEVADMANGILTSAYASNKSFIEYTSPMTACDCYYLGLPGYHKVDRNRNINWMEEALRKFEKHSDCPINKIDIYERLSHDYHDIRDYNKSIHYYFKQRIAENPHDPTIKLEQKSFKFINTVDKKRQGIIGKIPLSRDYDFYPVMCLKPYHSPNASLSCYYAHGPHPFLLLAPLKTERLHVSPPILLFRDVITDSEAMDFQELARTRFEQQASGRTAADFSNPGPFHQVAWLEDQMLEATTRVAKRIAQFSGLVVSADTAEDFQVTNYGTGGLYGPHYDFLRSNASSSSVKRDDDGKRIATALFYLSDVEEGGATVFTKLKVAVSPVKNAAVFWWNLDAAGDYDYQTLHAGCPVLYGSRWVTTKWISLYGQELVRPCPTSVHKTIFINSRGNENISSDLKRRLEDSDRSIAVTGPPKFSLPSTQKKNMTLIKYY